MSFLSIVNLVKNAFYRANLAFLTLKVFELQICPFSMLCSTQISYFLCEKLKKKWSGLFVKNALFFSFRKINCSQISQKLFMVQVWNVG